MLHIGELAMPPDTPVLGSWIYIRGLSAFPQDLGFGPRDFGRSAPVAMLQHRRNDEELILGALQERLRGRQIEEGKRAALAVEEA